LSAAIRTTQTPDLGEHTATACTRRVRPFARDQLPMPPQHGVGSDDRRNLTERLPSQTIGARGESPPVVISEAQAPLAQLAP
jgi:hypothetical protein